MKVYVEGEDEVVNEFCKFAKSNFPPDIVVDEVKVEDCRVSIGQSREFIEYGKQVLNKQGEMLEKQDEMIEAVKEVGERVNEVAEKIDDYLLFSKHKDRLTEKVKEKG